MCATGKDRIPADQDSSAVPSLPVATNNYPASATYVKGSRHHACKRPNIPRLEASYEAEEL